MSRRRTALALACAILSGTAAGDDDTIDEIQVTATRRPAAASDVSAALTFIPADEIADNYLLTDALSAEAGVFLQQTTPGQGAAIVRGLKGSEILHLVDGFRLNNAIFRNAPTQYLALVAPGTVERIEVLRGAPASLYGSDAVGGVVQVVSRVPRFEGPGTGVRRDLFAGLNSAEQGRTIRAAVDVGTQSVAGLFGAEYVETGDRRAGGGERIGPSGYRSKGARAAVSLTPAEGNTWLFDLQYAEQPATPRIDELVPGFGQTEPSSSEFLFSPNARSFVHVRHERVHGTWSADWAVDAGWQRIVDDRVTRDFGSDLRRFEQNESDLFGISLSAARETGFGSWIAGAEYYDDRVASTRVEEDVTTGQTQPVQARFPDGSTAEQAALFINLLFRAGERHRFTGGVRFSSVRVDLPETAISPAASVEPDDWSADAGWLFDIDEKLQFAANVGHGFRAPNVFDLGTLGPRPGNRFNIPNAALGSERVTQVDAGLRYRSQRWDADLVLFALRYEDRITSVLTGATTPDGRDVVQSRNVSEADINGVEATVQVALGDSITADAIVNYTRGEQTEADGTRAAGDRIPPLNGRAGLRYDASDSLSVESYLEFATRQDRLSPRDVRDPRIDPQGTAGWGTLSVRSLWQPRQHWTLTVAIENLLDKRYRVHGSGIDARGRNLLVSARVVW